MMELTDFQRKIQDSLPEIELCFYEPMAKHTSFRIGGGAEVMAFPKCVEQVAEIMNVSKMLDCKPIILGAGTNVLAPDQGISGLVICLKDCLGGMELVEGNQLHVMSGVTMTRAAMFAANHNLSGLEFAHGIPGTVGGGLYMNAGAYGGEIGDVCIGAEVMDFDGNLHQLSAEDLQFSYRHSALEERDWIVISARFQLISSTKDAVMAAMRQLMAKRSASQPLDLPSAGSAFKRPVGGYAAALIDQAGLKGYRVGGAAISTKHAGFAVNLGNATAEDVRSLLAQVSQQVFEKSGIRLEPEIRIW